MDATPQSPTTAGPLGSAIELALGTWLRYFAPLTLLSAIALSPIVVLAVLTHLPRDQAGANALLTLGWKMIGFASFGQLVLVGGASVMTRAPRSQLRAFGDGLVQLARAIVPCLAALVAIAIGSLALVVPGLVLLVLLALTGASRERGVPATLADSIAAARRQLPTVAIAVTAMITIDLAIGLVAQRAFVAPLPKLPPPVQLARIHHFVQVVALALVAISPLPATVLATIRARIEP